MFYHLTEITRKNLEMHMKLHSDIERGDSNELI